MTTLAERMKYQTLKNKLKEEHEKKLHNLELSYANIIVQLMHEKERVHKQMQNAFYIQIERINQMMFGSLFKDAVKHHYSQFSTTNNNNNDNSNRNQSINQKSTLTGHTLAMSNGPTPDSIVPVKLLPATSHSKSASVPTNNITITQNHKQNPLKTLLDAINHVEANVEAKIEANVEANTNNKNNKNNNNDCIQVENGFACRICNKVLARAYDIKRHIKCVHGDERPYKCDECGQAFKLQFHLKEHKVIHLSVRPFQCHFCNRRFSRKRDIAKHCNRRHKEQYVQFLKTQKMDL